MRRQGAYAPARIPTFAALVNASTADRAVLLRPLGTSVRRACRTYNMRGPDVHRIRAIATLAPEDKAALIDAYEGATVAVKRMLAAMIASLPQADVDLCPYCSLNQNPDLDHFLPKDKFSEFSLHGRNLVPICPQCNRKKKTSFKTQQGERLFLHATYEPTIDQPILEAAIDYAGSLPSVTYRLDDHGALPTGERAIALRHLQRLGLADRYSKRAHAHLSSLKRSMSGMSPGVKSRTLASKIDTAALGKPINDWEAALYRAVDVNAAPMLTWLTAA